MASPSRGWERSPHADDQEHRRRASGDDREPEQDGGYRGGNYDRNETRRSESERGDAGWGAPSAAPSAPSDGQRPVIFIKNLAMQTDNHDLEEIFRKFGKLRKVAIMYDPHTRESRGFAFVDYETVEEAQNAVNNTSNLSLHGREVHVELARRGRPRTPTPGRYCGLPKRTPRGPPPARHDSYSRDSYRARSPDYKDSYRRRELSPPRDRGDRYGGHGRERDHPRDPYLRDPYARDPYSSRGGGGGGGGGYDRYSPPPSGYDRRSPPRSSRYRS